MKNFTNSDMERIFCEIFGSYDVCNTKSSSTKNSTTKSSTKTNSTSPSTTYASIQGYDGPVEMDFSESGEIGFRPYNMEHKTFWYKIYQERLVAGKISESYFIELCNRLFK